MLPAARRCRTSPRAPAGGQASGLLHQLLNGDAINLLSRGPTERSCRSCSHTKTFDVEAGDSRAMARVMPSASAETSGTTRSTCRSHQMAMTETRAALPSGRDLHRRQTSLGRRGRVDKFSSIDNAVFSPRTRCSSSGRQSNVSRSFNRAFLAPSSSTTTVDRCQSSEPQRNLAALAKFILPGGRRQPDLKQETMTPTSSAIRHPSQPRDITARLLEHDRRWDLLYAGGELHRGQPAANVAGGDSHVRDRPHSTAGAAVALQLSESRHGEGQRRGARHRRRG